MTLVGLIPLLPLAGAAALLLFRRPLRRASGVLATSTVSASFLLALTVFGELLNRPAGRRALAGAAYDWIAAGGLRVAVEFRVDPLTSVMLLVVTGVGALIHAYSIGYMASDDRKATYFAYLNLFAASMLILVLADNFLVLYVGWEAVGLCSYLLISFWYFKPQAAAAGKKAFIVNRIGDLGFLLGILLIYRTFGTLDFDQVFGAASSTPLVGAVATAIPLLIFAGAVGKSAQIPLYVWLPDAMEGPTPVSALIHAATMVTAGVYVVARTHVLFEGSPLAATAVAVVGVATALYAATIATAQDDIKRVLAYSTVSQLGYMFLGVGIGALTGSVAAYAAGIFHLVTHAFFKALLFLGAGSVMHATGGEVDMKKMGGLRAALPVTTGTFVVGWLAIVGVPPLSGFFSKDAILAAAWEHGRWGMWLAGIAAAALTAFYMSRQVFLTFFGSSRLPADVHPHESPPIMTGPLRVLAFGAAAAGLWLALPWGSITRFLAPTFEGGGEVAAAPLIALPDVALALVTVAVSLLGVRLAYRLYLAEGAEARRERFKARLGRVVTLVRSKYYVDQVYGALFVWPAKTLAVAAAYGFDTRVIDGAVDGVGLAVREGAARLRRVQTGFVRRYVMAMLGGIVLVLSFFVARLR